tara:strand:+ start:1232 stop:2548 length:1317 start_codon:yes stop_codon:yes gene_type:complete
MSKIEVDAIEPQSGTALTVGANGDTITVPSGATFNVASGATINNQGTAVNFGATGSASWTSTIKTATFTAVAGEGYFCNTTSGGFTVNLPAGTAGAVVAVKDYANTFDSNNLTIAANGSDKIGGNTTDVTLSAAGIAVTLVFTDATRGWLVTDSGLQSEAPQTYACDFLVIAGGGGAGIDRGGGGGAGGYRNSFGSEASGGGGSSETALQFTSGVVYTITVGAGGTGSVESSSQGTNGGVSSIAGSGITTIQSTGGGLGGSGGGGGGFNQNGVAGGSGGGEGDGGSGGAGTLNQGFAGASADGGGGGGAAEAGDTDGGGYGGDGLESSITGSAVFRGGGGGGNATPSRPPGGSGGGGTGASTNPRQEGTAGTANTGGGGGGGPGNTPNRHGKNGGSGVVILSVPDAKYSGTTTGSPTVATGVSGKTVMTFTGDGSYTG